MSEYFNHTPAVFAVDKYYQIMIPCKKFCLFFVKVGDKIYYDESNGIMCSRSKIHKVKVPADELDKAEYGRESDHQRAFRKRAQIFISFSSHRENSFQNKKLPQTMFGNSKRAFFCIIFLRRYYPYQVKRVFRSTSSSQPNPYSAPLIICGCVIMLAQNAFFVKICTQNSNAIRKNSSVGFSA